MLLQVKHLSVGFRLGGGVESTPVRDVSFDIPAGARVAIVGESGSGKSLTALALGGLVDRAQIAGEIVGSPRIAYIFQNPLQSLNPVMKIGAQLDEAGASDLKAVGLDDSARQKYPCQLSGGQQQRVMIAMAIAQRPDLLIADEPTTALDVTTQKEVLELVDRIAAERKMAVLLITHNLGLVARHAEFVNVMYAGEIVEAGKVREVLDHPVHPYTQALLAAVPRLDRPRDAELADIPGVVPPPTRWPSGCAFHPRCRLADADCAIKPRLGCMRRAPKSRFY